MYSQSEDNLSRKRPLESPESPGRSARPHQKQKDAEVASVEFLSEEWWDRHDHEQFMCWGEAILSNAQAELDGEPARIKGGNKSSGSHDGEDGGKDGEDAGTDEESEEETDEGEEEEEQDEGEEEEEVHEEVERDQGSDQAGQNAEVSQLGDDVGSQNDTESDAPITPNFGAAPGVVGLGIHKEGEHVEEGESNTGAAPPNWPPVEEEDYSIPPGWLRWTRARHY
ncbi:hypothetical protein IE81DRAFT_367338 [Ceraceosorus guamensis]|uniref:Uncharacterized protein n=1 Tax=Ceraceosorus guamensis TaxID=1522189 RepID=A0A316VVK4_9BASI|nr:hypothetical protein IE81DRAFT_367338 [Ceraceosorus guamensis]PWN41636.1 hypothetical protein IE81DRAFT_367338 [Ceraceosorus guamensis]